MTQQRVQLDFINSLNNRFDAKGYESRLKQRIQDFEMAFRMQTSIPMAQDLKNESKTTKKLYGLDQDISENFGTQCLMARRFLEHGVRFVQVTHSALKHNGTNMEI